MNNRIKHIIVLAAATIAPAQADLLLKLDELTLGNTPMPIHENVDYDIFGQQVSVIAKFPVICNQIEGGQTASNLSVALNSPNQNEATSGVMGLVQPVGYNIRGGEVTMVTENLNKSLCLTSTLHDLILGAGFEDDDSWMEDYPSNFYFTGVVQSQPLNTQFTVGTEYVNTTGMTLELDYIDFWPSSDSLSVYSNHNGTNCSILDDQEAFVSTCPTDFNERGKYRNIFLAPGHKIVTENNLIIHSDSAIDEYLYLMTAIFTKVNTIQSGGQNQSFSGVEFIEAKIKVVQ